MLIRHVTRHTIDIVPIALILLAWAYLEIRGEWILVFLGCWFCFRLWWLYRQAVDSGLFDD